MRFVSRPNNRETSVDFPDPDGAEMIKTVVMSGFPPPRRRDAEEKMRLVFSASLRLGGE
jgi:hypothetical protein